MEIVGYVLLFLEGLNVHMPASSNITMLITLREQVDSEVLLRVSDLHSRQPLDQSTLWCSKLEWSRHLKLAARKETLLCIYKKLALIIIKVAMSNRQYPVGSLSNFDRS
jgi:hypothetical protein